MRAMEEEKGGKRVSYGLKELSLGYMHVGLPQKNLVEINVFVSCVTGTS